MDCYNVPGKDDHVEIDRFLTAMAIALVTGANADEQVIFKDFTLFPIVSHLDVLDGQGMDGKDLRNMK